MRALLLSLLLLAAHNLCAQIEFTDKPFLKVLEEAQENNKLIFVDAYASWCGPCKVMAKHVFTDPEVGEFYNNNFINVKIDMEKGQGPAFGSKYPVSAYPTLYYIDPKGNVVHKVTGGRKAEDFILLGKEALSKFNPVANYAELYNSGERDPELILNYVISLKQKGDDPSSIVLEHAKENNSLTDSIDLAIVAEGLTHMDNRVYEIYKNKRDAVINALGEEKYREKLNEAAAFTLKRAIKYEAPSLIEMAAGELDSEGFLERSMLIYASSIRDRHLFNTYLLKIDQKDVDDIEDSLLLIERLCNGFQSVEVSSLLTDITFWYESEIEAEDAYRIANLFFKLGDTSKAIEFADMAAENSDSDLYMQYRDWLKGLN